jgi:hypothetical protein
MVVNNKVDSLSYDVEAPPAQAPTTPAVVSAPPTPRGEAPAMTTTAAAELHKVSVPERRSTAKALRQRLAEVFFPDDPLHQFKNQSSARRLVLALQYFFPIFHWGSDYSLRLLRSDVVSGLTIASLAIPQARTQPDHTYTPLFCLLKFSIPNSNSNSDFFAGNQLRQARQPASNHWTIFELRAAADLLVVG